MALSDKFRKGGGASFWGTLKDLTFEVTEFKGEKKGEKGHSKVSARLEILKDGADEPTTQFLDAGFFYPDNMEVDGATVTTEKEGAAPLAGDSNFFKFVESAVENGFPEAQIDGSDFSPMIGWRFEFGREQDKARQLAAGKKKLGAKANGASEEDILKAGKRQDKNDKTKFYNHDYLVVRGVAAPEEAPKAGKKDAKKAADKPAKDSGKKAAAAAKDDGVDTDRADEVLKAIVENAKNKSVTKVKLAGEILKYQLANKLTKGDRDALIAAIDDESYLADAASRDVVNFDGTTITEAE